VYDKDSIRKSIRYFITSAENRELSLGRRIKECKRKLSENSDDESESDESEGEVPYKEHYMYDPSPDPFCAPDDIHRDTSNQRKET